MASSEGLASCSIPVGVQEVASSQSPVTKQSQKNSSRFRGRSNKKLSREKKSTYRAHPILKAKVEKESPSELETKPSTNECPLNSETLESISTNQRDEGQLFDSKGPRQEGQDAENVGSQTLSRRNTEKLPPELPTCSLSDFDQGEPRTEGSTPSFDNKISTFSKTSVFSVPSGIGQRSHTSAISGDNIDQLYDGRRHPFVPWKERYARGHAFPGDYRGRRGRGYRGNYSSQYRGMGGRWNNMPRSSWYRPPYQGAGKVDDMDRSPPFPVWEKKDFPPVFSEPQPRSVDVLEGSAVPYDGDVTTDPSSAHTLTYVPSLRETPRSETGPIGYASPCSPSRLKIGVTVRETNHTLGRSSSAWGESTNFDPNALEFSPKHSIGGSECLVELSPSQGGKARCFRKMGISIPPAMTGILARLQTEPVWSNGGQRRTPASRDHNKTTSSGVPLNLVKLFLSVPENELAASVYTEIYND